MVFTDDKLFYGIGPEVQSTDALSALKQMYVIVQQMQSAGFSKDDALKFLAEIIAAQSK